MRTRADVKKFAALEAESAQTRCMGIFPVVMTRMNM